MLMGKTPEKEQQNVQILYGLSGSNPSTYKNTRGLLPICPSLRAQSYLVPVSRGARKLARTPQLSRKEKKNNLLHLH